MKLSHGKRTEAFKMRTNSVSSRSIPPIFGRSPSAESPKGTISASSRRPELAKSMSAIEVTNIGSPSSGGYYSPRAQSELDQVFDRFDKNGDGKVSCYEIDSILGRFGESPTDDEVVRMLNYVDRDGGSFISLEETDRLSLVETAAAAAANLVDVFDVFDMDGDGKISVYELHRVFAALGDEDCTLEDCLRMIKMVDGDGDGYVSFPDFLSMMTS